MKTTKQVFWKVLLLGLVALPLSAAEPAEAPSLQVRIETPTVFDIARERDVSDALLTQLDTAFRRAGFEGRIAELDDLDKAAPEIPLLKLRLYDWDQNRTGFVECRFSAELATLDGQITQLGSFNGTAASWGRRDGFTLSKAFEDAAIQAMRELYRDLEKLDTNHADRASAR